MNSFQIFNEGEKVNSHFVEMARTIHAHPSLSEAVHEAALAVDKRVLHI